MAHSRKRAVQVMPQAVGAMLVIPAASGGFGTAWPVAAGLLAIAAVGACTGFLNGLLVVRLRLNAFIVTLAMLIVLRGLLVGATRGGTLFDMPQPFFALATATLLAERQAGAPLSGGSLLDRTRAAQARHVGRMAIAGGGHEHVHGRHGGVIAHDGRQRHGHGPLPLKDFAPLDYACPIQLAGQAFPLIGGPILADAEHAGKDQEHDDMGIGGCRERAFAKKAPYPNGVD